MALKIFIWIFLRMLSSFVDLLMILFNTNRKKNKWVVTVLEVIWGFLIYIVLRLVQFRRPILWTVFAASWSWVAGFLPFDFDVLEKAEENRIKYEENQGM